MSDWDAARADRAVAGYRRFQRIKAVLSVPFFLACLVLTWYAWTQWRLAGALVCFFVATPILAGVAGIILATPLGYLLCGADAMRLGREVELARMRRERS